MNNRYLYIREKTYQKEKDDLISRFGKNQIFIDYGLETESFETLIMNLKNNDEVVVRTFAHLGISSITMLDNIRILIQKDIRITSIDESMDTEETMSWIKAITVLVMLFYKIIAFLSSERLLNRLNVCADIKSDEQLKEDCNLQRMEKMVDSSMRISNVEKKWEKI